MDPEGMHFPKAQSADLQDHVLQDIFKHFFFLFNIYKYVLSLPQLAFDGLSWKRYNEFIP